MSATAMPLSGYTISELTFPSPVESPYPENNTVYAEYFPGQKPARYCIKTELVKPDCLVEIASIAHLA